MTDEPVEAHVEWGGVWYRWGATGTSDDDVLFEIDGRPDRATVVAMAHSREGGHGRLRYRVRYRERRTYPSGQVCIDGWIYEDGEPGVGELAGGHPLQYALVARAGSSVYVDETADLTDAEIRQLARDASRDVISLNARVLRVDRCPTCRTPSPCAERASRDVSG